MSELKLRKFFGKSKQPLKKVICTTTNSDSWIIEGVHARNLKATLLPINFSEAFHSIQRGKMEQILLAYDLPKEAIIAIMILYKNTKAMVSTLDDDTNFFDFVNGVLQGDRYISNIYVHWILHRDMP